MKSFGLAQGWMWSSFTKDWSTARYITMNFQNPEKFDAAKLFEYAFHFIQRAEFVMLFNFILGASVKRIYRMFQTNKILRWFRCIWRICQMYMVYIRTSKLWNRQEKKLIKMKYFCSSNIWVRFLILCEV